MSKTPKGNSKAGEIAKKKAGTMALPGKKAPIPKGKLDTKKK